MEQGGLHRQWSLPWESRLRGFVHAHERGLTALTLALGAGTLVVLAWWGLLGNGLERWVDRRIASWPARVDAARALVEAGRFEEAATALELLDARFPARSVKHRFDRERERLLALLGRSHMELDRKGRALETFERLAAFDPRNFENHVLLAQACERFGEDERALEAYGTALALHPAYLPAVEGLVALHVAAGHFPPGLEAFERYLDAFLLARMQLVAGDASTPLELLADGRVHELELPLELPAGWSGELCLESAGYSVRIESLELLPPQRAGIVAPRSAVRVGAEGWSAHEAEAAGPGAFAAQGPAASLCRPLELPQGAARVRVRIAVCKALTPGLWSLASTCYRNTVALEREAQARARILVGGTLQAGSLFRD